MSDNILFFNEQSKSTFQGPIPEIPDEDSLLDILDEVGGDVVLLLSSIVKDNPRVSFEELPIKVLCELTDMIFEFEEILLSDKLKDVDPTVLAPFHMCVFGPFDLATNELHPELSKDDLLKKLEGLLHPFTVIFRIYYFEKYFYGTSRFSAHTVFNIMYYERVNNISELLQELEELTDLYYVEKSLD